MEREAQERGDMLPKDRRWLARLRARVIRLGGYSTAPCALKWRKIGAVKPVRGDELRDSKLAEVLARKSARGRAGDEGGVAGEERGETGETELTADEWEMCGISNLQITQYVRAGDAFYQPAVEAQPYLRCKFVRIADSLFSAVLLAFARSFHVAREEASQLEANLPADRRLPKGGASGHGGPPFPQPAEGASKKGARALEPLLPSSSPAPEMILYNLGLVREALGDVAGARGAYSKALQVIEVGAGDLTGIEGVGDGGTCREGTSEGFGRAEEAGQAAQGWWEVKKMRQSLEGKPRVRQLCVLARLNEELMTLKYYHQNADKLKRLDCLETEEEARRVKVRAANRAYRDSPGGFEAVFGNQKDFYMGLEAYSGRPMVAGDKKLYYEMRREFSECQDPRIRFITTTNNGNVNTVIKTTRRIMCCVILVFILDFVFVLQSFRCYLRAADV